MKTLIHVDNLKCGGCEHTVTKEMKTFDDVSDVLVDAAAKTVEVTYSNPNTLIEIKHKLAKLGYPESGTLEGISKLGANAKSYISCAIGRISPEA